MGAKKIALQEELAQAVAIKARDIGEEYATIFKNTQQELEDEITSIAQEIAQGAYALRKHLSDAEIEEMIAPYTKRTALEQRTSYPKSQADSTISA